MVLRASVEFKRCPHLSAATSRRRLGHLKTISFQLLWHHIEIECDDSVEAALWAIAQRATHDFEPHIALRFSVASNEFGTFNVAENGDLLASNLDAVGVVNELFRRIFRRSFEFASRSGWVRVHAALVEIGGRALLVVGESGAGKTTLALRLGLAGCVVQSDESVLIRTGTAVGVPRRFHAKGGASNFVPALLQGDGQTPTLSGTEICAVAPTDLGIQWSITPRQIDHIVCISDVAGSASLSKVHSGAAMGVVLGQVLRCVEPHRTVVSEVVAALVEAQCWAMTGAGNVDACDLLFANLVA